MSRPRLAPRWMHPLQDRFAFLYGWLFRFTGLRSITAWYAWISPVRNCLVRIGTTRAWEMLPIRAELRSSGVQAVVMHISIEYCSRYTLVTNEGAEQLLRKPDLTGIGLRKSLTAVPFEFWIYQKTGEVIFLENNCYSNILKSVEFKWCSCMDFNLLIMFIPVNVYNAVTDIWNRIFGPLCCPQHWCILSSYSSTIWRPSNWENL